ncbi:hypothetical protein L3Q82_021140, partial [Scortum barcoo]
RWVGISASALEWFSSYLSDRTFSVTVHNFVSLTESLCCGVPQGSVLGPMLFERILTGCITAWFGSCTALNQ